jgi:tetratricopeptide (TPR) repeat protein
MRNRRALCPLFCYFVSLFWLTAHAVAQENSSPPDVVRIWQHHNNNGWRHFDKGEFVKAAERFDLAIKEVRPFANIDRRLLSRSYCDLARALYQQGRYAEAEPLAVWALSERAADKRTKPDSMFQCVYVLAIIHKAEKHYTDAEQLLKRAIALQEKNVGPNHPGTAATLEQLAVVYTEQDKNGEAALLYRRLLSIYEQFNPDQNLDLADTAERYSAVMEKMHRPVEAERWKERAQTIRDNVGAAVAKARVNATTKDFRTAK